MPVQPPPRPVSRVPVEWGEGATFTMHNVEQYKRMATEPCFDYWLRTWWFAVANVRANGHAPLRQQMLAQALGRAVDGVWVPASTHTVRDAIALAKEKNLLDPSSKALCLVPARAIVAQGKRERGEVDDACPRHPSARRVAAIRAVPGGAA